MNEGITIGDEALIRKMFVDTVWYRPNILTVVSQNDTILTVRGGDWSESEGNTIHIDNVFLYRKRVDVRNDTIDKLLEDS